VSFKPEDVRIPYDEYNDIRKEPTRAPSSVDPQHYTRWPVEPLAFCMANDLPFWLGNVIKYCMRYDAKDGLKDLYKAKRYLQEKIRELEKGTKDDF
jgi:hypothetical protein